MIIDIGNLETYREHLLLLDQLLMDKYQEDQCANRDYERATDHISKQLDVIDVFRPISPGGEHGDGLHTQWCGCVTNDNGTPITYNLTLQSRAKTFVNELVQTAIFTRTGV